MENRYKISIILILSFVVSCWRAESPKPRDEPVKLELIGFDKRVVSEGKIRPGDTLVKILLRAGCERRYAFEIIECFKKVFDVRKIKPARRYSLTSDSSGIIQVFEYFAEPEMTVYVERDSAGIFSGRLIEQPLIKRIRSLRGLVINTLYDAVLDLGESPELIVAFSDVFQWDIDFFIDPRQGDEFRMVYETEHIFDPMQPDSLGEFIRYGRVLAGQYIMDDGKFTAVYYELKPGSGGYYDLRGRSFQKTFLKSPLNYRRISSYFSGARRHPILKIVRPHYAVDFASPLGTPVSAAGDGIVKETGYDRSVGRYVKIQHKNPRFVTLYGHLSGVAAGIKKGVAVKQRDVLGYVGKTGLATGPHLHYAFYENGRPINPLRIKNTTGDPIPSDHLANFNKEAEKLVWRLVQARWHQSTWPFVSMFHSRVGIGRRGLPAP